jgi:hypothetical protein
MSMKKQFIRLLLLMFLGSLSPFTTIRAESQERYTPILSFELGLFFAFMDSTLHVDSSSGEGTEIDLEDILKFDSNRRIYRIQGSWEFSQRFHLEVEYYRVVRTSTFIALEENIQVSDETFEAGSTLDGSIKTQLLRFNLYYALVQLKRLSLGPYIGLNVARNNYKVEASAGGLKKEASTDINELVPSFGLFSTIILHPKVRLNMDLDYFPHSLTDFENFSQLNFEINLEFYPIRHVGLGVAYDYRSLKIDSARGDFLGKLQTKTSGFLAYIILGL